MVDQLWNLFRETGDPMGYLLYKAEQKKQQLYLKQKDLLETFLSHHAISQAQYDKSLHDLMEKTGYGLPEEI